MNVLSEELRLQAEVLKSLTITLAAILLSTNLTPISKQNQTEIESENLSEYRIQLVEPIATPELTEHELIKEIPKPKPKTQPTASVKPTGDKYTWLRQAGIPESDWQYVDEIITRESGWNYKAVNRSSGATGLCQSLPASKMASAGGDYLTNPVTQLKWCHGYAQGYGSWAKAAEYSRCIGNCFSARVNRVVYKDHKWW